MPNCPACQTPIDLGLRICPSCGFLRQTDSDARLLVDATPRRRVFGCLGVSCLSIVLLLGTVLWPAVREAREAARRSNCKGHLKGIGLALHNYHDQYNCFPPAFIADENGTPIHSWRVLILPFINESELYARYRFDEPWDSANNRELLTERPKLYGCPSDPHHWASSFTAYAGVYGPRSIFQGSEPVRIKDISDGTSNTLAVGEVAHETKIPWTKPEDVDVTLHSSINAPNGGWGSHHDAGAHFLISDGSVRFLSERLSAETLRALFTRDGGEQVGEF